jgi:hypothetical protein
LRKLESKTILIGVSFFLMNDLPTLLGHEFTTHLGERIALIPCTGYGGRAGAPLYSEMLPHPRFAMSFLAKAIERAQNIGYQPLVISRLDKVLLNDWLRGNAIPHALVTPRYSWIQSMQVTQPLWKAKNMVIMPDVDFRPEGALAQVAQLLESNPVVMGVFNVEAMDFWGGVKFEGEKVYIGESIKTREPGLNWGLIGFQQASGEELWRCSRESQIKKEWLELNLKVSSVPLHAFFDHTK